MDLYILRSSFDCKHLIKPEIHNVSQRRQSLRPSHGERYHAEKNCEDWMCSFGDMDPDRHTNTQTERQTDRQIYTLIILVRHPYHRCKKV